MKKTLRNIGGKLKTNNKLKHPGMGIAFFILGIVSAILVVVIIGIIISISETLGSDETVLMLIGFISMFLCLISIVGGILGIISVCLKNKKKILGILGICFNIIPLVCIIGIILLGLAQ